MKIAAVALLVALPACAIPPPATPVTLPDSATCEARKLASSVLCGRARKSMSLVSSATRANFA